MRNHWSALALAGWLVSHHSATGALDLVVRDSDGKAVENAMLTHTFVASGKVDTSDNGYPAAGTLNIARPQHTRFSDGNGSVHFDDADEAIEIRVRKPGYRDLHATLRPGETPSLVLVRETDPLALAESKPSNLWLSQLDFAGATQQREHFLGHCGFCHQQASPFMRSERSSEQWLQIIERMNRYGAQIAHEFWQPLADYLPQRYATLRAHPELLPDFEPWGGYLSRFEITEWPIGDSLSQMHDFLLHPNGMVYVGDNLMDRIYEINPATGEYRIYKVPHAESDQIGGILGNRFANGYPKVENYFGIHSLALSQLDGHIFITPSMQQALLEFDPATKQFRKWEMSEGFYPHTIRIDHKDRVWFTLALSSKVAMFDRKAQSFTYYDLPPRGLKERAILWGAQQRLGTGKTQQPPNYDWENSGFPMPYGIDVAPDGTIWVARLYANDLARIVPDSGAMEMIPTPFTAPRRLRCDAQGNPWIVGFSSGLIARYDAINKEFKTWPLPLRSETPYALNVDKKRNVVWVNGNQSDTVMRFDIASESWQTIPLSRYRTFSRDIEIAEDGSIYTSNSNFPAWQIEGGQPTLIRIRGIP